MKNLFFFTLVILVLIACEGPIGPAGPAGKDGEGVSWHITSFTINTNEWKIKGNPGDLNSYFYVYKSLPKLTGFVYQWGTVIAYIEVAPGVKNEMPYVLHLGETANSKELIWTQTYDFDFTEGEVGFYVTYSDFNTQIRPGTETFHVVLMW